MFAVAFFIALIVNNRSDRVIIEEMRSNSRKQAKAVLDDHIKKEAEKAKRDASRIRDEVMKNVRQIEEDLPQTQ